MLLAAAVTGGQCDNGELRLVYTLLTISLKSSQSSRSKSTFICQVFNVCVFLTVVSLLHCLGSNRAKTKHMCHNNNNNRNFRPL